MDYIVHTHHTQIRKLIQVQTEKRILAFKTHSGGSFDLLIEFDSLQHFLTFVRKKKWYTHEKEEEWREILGRRLSLSKASVVSWPTLE